MNQPLILLSSMRSMSSRTCAMLGQHPDAFGMPELNLFVADEVGELLRVNQARSHAMHGLLRLLAELHEGEQTEASVDAALDWLHGHSDWSTAALFQYVVDSVHPKLAVEKSSRTALQTASLERAYEAAPEASYLHLTRHPRSAGQAMLESLADEAGDRFKRIDPEKMWLRAHENINEFAENLALGQCMRIRVEDLYSRPEFYLEQIAEWLDIDTSTAAIEAMLHPERSVFAVRGPANAELGSDPDFLDNPKITNFKIEAQQLEGDVAWAADGEFSPQTLKLAREMGY